jgi:phage baseplate assembly protein V
MDATSIERVYRRVLMLFGRGRATFVDDSGPVQTMQVTMSDIETLDNRIRVAEFGFSSNPPIGSDVLALHVGGDRSAGAVIGTNHQPSRPRGLAPGESMLYSQDGKYVYITAAGGLVVFANGQNVVVNGAADITMNCSGNFTVNCGGNFNVNAGGNFSATAPSGSTFDTPLLSATGDIQDKSGTNSNTMALMRAIYNTHTHPIDNVTAGSSSVTSNAPTQTE